jgi:hypothetical protein
MLRTSTHIGELFIQNPAGFSSTKCPESGIPWYFLFRLLVRNMRYNSLEGLPRSCRDAINRVSTETRPSLAQGKAFLSNQEIIRNPGFCR